MAIDYVEAISAKLMNAKTEIFRIYNPAWPQSHEVNICLISLLIFYNKDNYEDCEAFEKEWGYGWCYHDGDKKNWSIQHDKSSENMIKTFFIASFNHHSQMLTLQMTSLL